MSGTRIGLEIHFGTEALEVSKSNRPSTAKIDSVVILCLCTASEGRPALHKVAHFTFIEL